MKHPYQFCPECPFSPTHFGLVSPITCLVTLPTPPSHPVLTLCLPFFPLPVMYYLLHCLLSIWKEKKAEGELQPTM